MRDIEVLWLDGDSPRMVGGFNGASVVTAQTCAQADGLLISKRVNPDWVVVDLVVPQGGWGSLALVTPGLHYIQYLKRMLGDRCRILVFSTTMSSELRHAALMAGAVGIYEKRLASFADVVRYMINSSTFHP